MVQLSAPRTSVASCTSSVMISKARHVKAGVVGVTGVTGIAVRVFNSVCKSMAFAFVYFMAPIDERTINSLFCDLPTLFCVLFYYYFFFFVKASTYVLPRINWGFPIANSFIFLRRGSVQHAEGRLAWGSSWLICICTWGISRFCSRLFAALSSVNKNWQRFLCFIKDIILLLPNIIYRFSFFWTLPILSAVLFNSFELKLNLRDSLASWNQ